eukprot:gene692-746_t
MSSIVEAKNNEKVRLTQYSHGAGCGCKLSPKVLDKILSGSGAQTEFANLWVGHASKDDCAVVGINEETGILSTTDFFMPIVDDPFDFGKIAATNAISDIYAMGGKPIVAIAILGWPLSKLPPEVASEVVRGGRDVCTRAGIALAGGHSIDAPEPIFGLAVTGIVEKKHLKQNNTAKEGCKLFLTKPLGVGILTTAEKKQLLQPEDVGVARDSMCVLNSCGAVFGQLAYVTAMTDVTGFGLLGHLIEVAEGSNLTAVIHANQVPTFPRLDYYLSHGCASGGVSRNFDSYGSKVSTMPDYYRQVFCDPQTSGGLLVAVEADHEEEFLSEAAKCGLALTSFGQLVAKREHCVEVL